MLDYGFYNMDCMEGMKEFPDNYFDLAIVDPVYGGVGRGGYMTHKGGEKWGNGRGTEIAYNNAIWSQPKTDKTYFDELFRVSKNQIIWGGNYFTNSICRESQCWIVWDKKKAEGIKFADCELAWTSFDRAARIFRFRWNGFLQEDMKHKEKKIHPTQKPVALYKWILGNFAVGSDRILDTHVGSGSSLIACHQMGNPYVGFEINEDYYNKAKERIQEETGQLTIQQIGFNPYQE
ncbi:MAG: site-specific DNA-methyltransferase [Parasporobacterium sp.]|nr:site-specific DNA-methyltransferase [Parasporobacterium sp.]